MKTHVAGPDAPEFLIQWVRGEPGDAGPMTTYGEPLAWRFHLDREDKAGILRKQAMLEPKSEGST